MSAQTDPNDKPTFPWENITNQSRHEMMLSITFLLSFVVVSLCFLPQTIVLGPTASFIDSFTLVKDPSTSNHHQKIRLSTFCLLSNKISGNADQFINGDNSNITAPAQSNRTQNITKTKGYRRIEEWHEETRDSKHVIRQLQQEKARWKKTFDDLGT